MPLADRKASGLISLRFISSTASFNSLAEDMRHTSSANTCMFKSFSAKRLFVYIKDILCYICMYIEEAPNIGLRAYIYNNKRDVFVCLFVCLYVCMFVRQSRLNRHRWTHKTIYILKESNLEKVMGLLKF